MHQNEEAHLAVVGMGCIFPGARAVADYWRNIVAGRDLIARVPPERWRESDYYDPDPAAPDRTYCRRGGFIAPLDFDPTEFGLPPRNLSATDPSQILALIAARDALRDAFGGELEGLDRAHAAVVLGASPLMELSGMMGMRAALPLVRRALDEAGLPEDVVAAALARCASKTVAWQENTFPGMLSNVIAGRIASRFDLHGSNFTIDAACASSLTVLGIAQDELVRRRANVVLCGGSDTANSGLAFIAFSKTPALSPSEECRPFSEDADGTLLGEGVAMLVLKRLSDAERDGDAIHAVVRAVATSSDGRAKSIFAPNAAGQELALERAYAAAGVSPRTVELLEGHGTGTRVGDAEEVLSAARVFAAGGEVTRPWCALGSVKSQIGHTKCAAGAAGAMKAVLALRHATLPPTIKVDKPNARLREGGVPFYLNTRARPWIRGSDHPRRAAVTALGFGGTNAHLVLEEYRGPGRRPAKVRTFPSELVVLSGADRADLARACRALLDEARADLSAADAPDALAALALASQRAFDARAPWRLATVVADVAELTRRLGDAARMLPEGLVPPRVHVGSGAPGKIAFLFPGQGAQHVDMGADLAMAFDVAREVWDRHGSVALADGVALHEVVFPPPALDADGEARLAQRLTDTRWAQPALGATQLAMLAVLRALGITADAAAGHSFGELSALATGGAMSDDVLMTLAAARGRAVHAAARVPGAMLAIQAGAGEVDALCREVGVTVANDNAPSQVVASGTVAAIEALAVELGRRGIACRRLAVAAAFHSPLVERGALAFADDLARAGLRPPRTPVFSNVTAAPYGSEPPERVLARQIGEPVRFRESLLALHDAGARIFVDIGPSALLARFVEDTLADRPHLAVRMAPAQTHGVTALHEALARLVAAGVVARFGALWEGHAEPRAAAAIVPKLAVSVSGRVHGAPYPPIGGDEAHAGTPTSAPPRAATPSSERAHVVHALHARMAEAQARFERHLSESHLAFLRLSESALRELGADHAPPTAAATTATATTTAAAPSRAAARSDLAPEPPAEREAMGAEALLRIVSECTGYPVELLALDMKIEADLGIDSIRRMEILGRFVGGSAAVTALDAERSAALARLETLGDVLAFVAREAPELIAPPAAGRTSQRGDVVRLAEAEEPRVAAAPTTPLVPEPSASADRLLTIVSRHTGYPTELLTLDMRIEADLGIDSIRRMQILGDFLELAPERARGRPDDPRLTTLARLETLGDVLDYLQGELAAARVEPHAAARVEPHADDAVRAVLTRRTAAAPPPPSRAFDWRDATVAVLGGAPALARGVEAKLLSEGARVQREPDDTTTVVVHLGPLGALEGASATGERGADGVGAGAARDLLGDLCRTAQRLGAGFARRGRFMLVQDSGAARATLGSEPGWSAAGSAFLRTLAQEWPGLRVCALEIASSGDAVRDGEAIVDALARAGDLDELAVDLHAARSVRELAPVPRRARPPSRWHEGVVVVSGGGRGITVDVLCALAAHVRPRVLALGRTPLVREPGDLPASDDLGLLQRALLERQPAGGRVDLAAIRAEATALANAHALRTNLARLAAAGLDVHYRALDIADVGAVAAALARAREELGPIGAVVHAAGAVADKRIEDKTPAQLDRVMRTKVDGLAALLGATRDDHLELVAAFSSVAAVRGSAGQIDYAAANAFMTDLLRAEATRRPSCRVHALAFGPVAGGMLTASLQAHYREREIPVMPLDVAARTAAAVLLGDYDALELVLEARGEARP